MKQVLATLPLLLLFAGCGDVVTDAMVSQRRAERDSLKSEREQLNTRIAEVESWLAKHDPELKQTLPTVTTFTVHPRPFAHYTEAHGSVKADQNALVYSSTGGEVRAILVHPGQRVAKGQLIVDIDVDVLRSNIAQAKANVDLARQVYDRQSKLWEQKIGSEVQYLEARTRKEAAEAQLNALQDQLASAQVTAPFAGVVDEVFPNLGDMANPMQPVARVVSLGKASIECDLAEDLLSRVKVGDPVEVELPGSGETFQATIDQVGQYINPNNRTFKATLRVTNGTPLRPNELANVRIRDAEQEDALVLPSRLVMQNSTGESYVFALEERNGELRARKVMVNVLSAQGDEVQVARSEDGLKGGEQLIDQGSRLVVNDQEVQVRKQV